MTSEQFSRPYGTHPLSRGAGFPSDESLGYDRRQTATFSADREPNSQTSPATNS